MGNGCIKCSVAGAASAAAKDEYAKKILAELEKIDVGKLTSDMVKIPSYSFMEEQEKEISEYISAYFTAEGIENEITQIEPGRYNVVAKLPGKNSQHAKSLQFNGHMDTVPPYDFEDAFSGRIADGKVYGRGSIDMKGPIASIMTAMTAIKRAGIELDGDLYFTGVADEEEQGKGAKYISQHGPFTDGAVVCEGSNMVVQLGNKGLEWIEVIIEGKKTHAGASEKGINAIQMAARFVDYIYDKYTPVLKSRRHPILGDPTINIGTINGGDQPSTVAGECRIKLDRRCVPGETIEQVYSELEDIIAELNKEDPRFKATIRDVFEGVNDVPHMPFATEPEDPIVKCARNGLALEKYYRHNEVMDASAAPLGVCTAWTDAGFIANNTDAKCIIFGPGLIEVAHSVREYIDIEEMERAAFVYAMMANEYCK